MKFPGLRLISASEFMCSMGPGFLKVFMRKYLNLNGKRPVSHIIRQSGIRVIHEGADMGIGFMPDMVIDEKIVIEFKSVETLAEVHYKQ